ncbi:MAG: 4Fe-4S binding protein, partial [Anaerolineae bacterium]
MTPRAAQSTTAPQHASAGQRRAVVLVRLRPYLQALFLVLFVVLIALAWVLEERRGWANLFFRLDLLAGAAGMLAGRRFLPALLLSLLTLGLTLLAGRAWCAWVCPLGTLLDWAPARRQSGAAFGPQSPWRRAKYILLTAVAGLALAGSLTLLLLDPIVLTSQMIGRIFLPLLEQVFTLLERAGFAIPWTRPLVSQADNLLRGTIFPLERHFYGGAVLTGLLFAGILALNALAPRFWCRHLC